ncbi:MAG: phosphatase PAP2 family protein [Candidatus Methanomethylophilaceae archaeon]|nr:phosphatase PAP2 family protein [Candidatus Methanomethylophilaceae archaeon]
MNWEAEVLFWIRDNLTCGFMDWLMSTVSLLCTADIVWFVLTAVLIYRKDTRKVGVTLLLALIISIIICNGILKPTVERIRPYDEFGVSLIVPASSEFSFPSGHTTGVTVVTAVLLKHFRKWGYLMSIFAVMVMFSRMYLFMHYPTDILGGIAVGIVSVILAHVIMSYLERRKEGRIDGMR